MRGTRVTLNNSVSDRPSQGLRIKASSKEPKQNIRDEGDGYTN